MNNVAKQLPSELGARALTLGYDRENIISGLSLDILQERFTVLIGPNACGKSTLLKGLARLLRPTAGDVILDGKSIHSLPTKLVAKKLGLLPQSVSEPEGLDVYELVSRGRYAHQGMLCQWSKQDKDAVEWAIEETGVSMLANKPVNRLSGGQRQRVWIAAVLAQQTDIILLDEPTTFLDLTHQLDLLELLQKLNKEHKKTIVAILHDLNQTFRYAGHVIVMQNGKLVKQGTPQDVATEKMIEEVFDLPCIVIKDPLTGTPMIVPKPKNQI